MRKRIPLRKTFFVPGEGESELSLNAWLNTVLKKHGLHVHLEGYCLGGGGYEIMLGKAIKERERREKTKTKFHASILIVDSDRGEQGDDGWTINQLKQEALNNKFFICMQRPKIEGLFLRMFPGKENLRPDSLAIDKQLHLVWSNYKKPADKQTLASKFSFEDLLRVANLDEDLKNVLTIIGLEKYK